MMSGNLGRINYIEMESGPQWVLHEIPKMYWKLSFTFWKYVSKENFRSRLKAERSQQVTTLRTNPAHYLFLKIKFY